MKKRLFSLLLCALMVVPALILPVGADVGPKPSVTLTVKGLEGRACWATLLSTKDSNGPLHSLWKKTPMGERIRTERPHAYGPQDAEYAAYQAFLEYEEGLEELFFLPHLENCSEGPLRWTYRPPEEFQVLLYFPETDSFAAGEGLVEQYAFHSYYAVDLTGVELPPGGTVEGLRVARNYNNTWEWISLAIRVVLTVAVELALARRFGLREKGQRRLILGVNVVTQGALNLGLNLWVYHFGSYFLFGVFLAMELAVTMAEAAVYLIAMPGLKGRGDRGEKLLTYAFAANGLSLALGWVLALVIPGIF